MKKIRKTDLLLLSAILVVGLILGLILLLTRTEGRAVQIRVDGTVVAEYPLAVERDCVIDGYEGGTNRLIISGGKARITEASCPDGLCVNMGSIRATGESIVCLPNRVVVAVIGNDTPQADEGIDIIVGGQQ